MLKHIFLKFWIFIFSAGVHLDNDCLRNYIAPSMIWMCSFINYPYCPQFTYSSFDHLLLSLSWSEYYLFSFFTTQCIAPDCSTFQGVLKSVNVISIQEFANSVNFLLAWQYFLFSNQISYFKYHIYSSLIVEMKSERC